MLKISRIQIKNFRSIVDLDIEISDLTVFVGDNDCGKSNILRALNLFFNDQTNPEIPFRFRDDWNRNALIRNKAAKQIEVTLDIELPESYQKTNGAFVRWKKFWRETGYQEKLSFYEGKKRIPKLRGDGFKEEAVEISDKSNVHTLLRKIEFEYVPAVRSAVYFRNLRGRIFNVISEVAEKGMRDTSGTFENAIAGHVEDLTNSISDTLGDESRISMPNDLSTIFESLDFLEGDTAISLDNRGDGIKARYIPLILKFIADQKRKLQTRGTAPHTFIWAYEEPENNLEFRRAQQLADNFCDLADDKQAQILLTTHSPIFFNLTNCDDNRMTAHVSQVEKSKGTTAIIERKPSQALDQRMGVMPIIAPYIKEASEKICRLNNALAKAKNTIAENPLPAFFVEGTTDYKVVSAILTCMSTNWRTKVNLVLPPDTGAGTAYIANQLQAWQLLQKDKIMTRRLKAVGLLDCDAAGCKTNKLINQKLSCEKKQYASGSLLKKPKFAQDAAKLGLILPIALEEHYPKSWWEYADNQNWLEARILYKFLSEDKKQSVLKGESSTNDVINSVDNCIQIEKSVKSLKKGDWADWCVSQIEKNGCNELSLLVQSIENSLQKIDVKL